ncbi:MAG: DUF2325 domain-containing protein [Pseudomonadota bacterium]|nr:DUF2325 domain-containing protein [Pseudomonadota bacterium]
MQEHTVLLRAYARAQERCSRLLAGQAARIAQLEAQVVRLRGALVLRDCAAAIVRDALSPHAAAGLTLSKRLLGLLQAGRRRVGAPQPAAGVLGSDLRRKAVLCVGEAGGDSGLARQLVEIAGGHYLHHAGDVLEEADQALLDASLRAADLVICRTGCLSHGAFWRVQDHCRRTGKPCVLVGQEATQPLHFMRRAAAAEDSEEIGR